MIDATRAQTLQLDEIHEKYSIEYIVGSEKGLTIEGTKENNYFDFTQIELKNVSSIDVGYGDDVVIGSSGDDVILAGAGNDVLSGGEGQNDVLVLSGNRTDYRVSEQPDGSLVIEDARGIDGKDTVSGFERYQFGDQAVGSDVQKPFVAYTTNDVNLTDSYASDMSTTYDTQIIESSNNSWSETSYYTTLGDGYETTWVTTTNYVVETTSYVTTETVWVQHHDLFYGETTDWTYDPLTGSTWASFSTSNSFDTFYTDSYSNMWTSNSYQTTSSTSESYSYTTYHGPADVQISGNSVSEDAVSGAIVGNLYATTADNYGSSCTFELVDASGNAMDDSNFVVQDNSIVVRDGSHLNFESQESQTLHVRATDQSGWSVIRDVTVNVQDANDAPTGISLDGGSVTDAATPGTIVGRLSTADADRTDSHAYQIVDANGNDVADSSFAIKDNAIVVRDGSSLDYESSATQTLFVKTTDQAGASYTETIQITVTDANDAPTGISLDGGSVSEAATADSIVGRLSTSDSDRTDSHTYQIVDANGNAVDDSNFAIQDNAIVVRDGSSLDYESSSTQTLFVKTTDTARSSYTEAIQINITDANDAPTAIKLDGGSVSEAATAGTIVGRLSTIDVDRGNSHSYQLVDAKGNAVDGVNFEVKGDAIVVRDGGVLDYESSPSQMVFLKTTDQAGAAHVEAFQISVTDSNDAPTAIKLDGQSLSEAVTAGTIVGRLSTCDADRNDSHTYQIVDANGDAVDNVSFEIKGDQIIVRDDSTLDYELNSTQTLLLKTTDEAGASFTETIGIAINDANDAPTSITLDGGPVSEAASAGTVVGTLSTADADKIDLHSYQLVDAKGNAVKDTNFAIRENAVVVLEGSSLNYESSSSQTLFVKTTDNAGASFTESIKISVSDANDAPTAIDVEGNSVSESASAGTVVGKLHAKDADRDDSHTYQLVDRKDNSVDDSNFVIKENVIVVREGATLDFESSSIQTLSVKTTDEAGASYTETIQISITDANDAPTAIKLYGGAVSESATGETVVGKLSAVDADRSDSHTYQLVDARGNAVKDENFAINENAIVVREGSSLDFETNSSQTLFVKSTDRAGASHIEQFTVQVDDINEAPTAITGFAATSEDVSVVVQLTGADIDARDSIKLVRIDQLPQHGQLFLNGQPVETNEDIAVSDVQRGGLVFVADKDWHGDTRLSFSVFDGAKWSEASAEIAIHVEAVADESSLLIEPARGLVGETIPLTLAASTLDLDGSERLTMRISGLPDGAKLSAGIRQTDGTWLLSSADLPSLMLTLPQDGAQQFDLAITVTTTERNGSASTTSGSLHVTVDAPVSIVPVGSPPTGRPTQVFVNTNQENAERQIEQSVDVTELPSEVSLRESAGLPERPIEDVRPVGDMFVTIRNQSIDWSETQFGDVQEIVINDRADTESDRSYLQATLSADNQSLNTTATTNAATESVSSFVWMWSAVRALTGMRDERRSR